MNDVPRFKSTNRPIDETPEEVLYFWVLAIGNPYSDEPSITERLYHVGCAHPAEAREVVTDIENGRHEFASGDAPQVRHIRPPEKPWRVVEVKPATQHVDPSGEADAIYS